MKKIKEVDFKTVKEAFDKMGSNKGNLGLSLLEEAEFMKGTLKELKKNVEDKGVVTEMCQGDYSIERANPALSQYNSLIKNYNSTIKQMTDLLEAEPPKNPEDEFDDFNK